MMIDWQPPAPRSGVGGWWDRLIGPGATNAEQWLQLSVACAAAIAVPVYTYWQGLDWTVGQMIVAALLAFDLFGGVITNATGSAKRWYHRSGQGFWQHWGFVALHGVQLLIVAWLFRGMDWLFFATIYGYLLGVTVIVLKAPLYLQRPLALLALCDMILVNHYLLPSSPGLEWFVPILFLKLLVSHLLKEAPYLPQPDQR